MMRYIWTVIGLMAVVGFGIMQRQAGAVPTNTPVPLPSLGAPLPTLTAQPSAAPASPTATLLPTNTPRSTQVMLEAVTPVPVAGALFDSSGELRDHYWLARPFPRDPNNMIQDFGARNYAYGSTAGGAFSTHHGLDFQNGFGTAILAAARGRVLYAGDDSTIMFGPRNDFYGNLVVIEHEFVGPNGAPVFTLYGHMSRVEVETGDQVEFHQKIGQVGSTGVAMGAHLHLEVRIGDPYDYYSTYNPDLWLQPWPAYGTLAGRIYDKHGERMYGTAITIQPVRTGPGRTAYSYADDAVNPDPYYGEHFTYGDLRAGDYYVMYKVRDVIQYKAQVTIEDGKTSWIEIRLK